MSRLAVGFLVLAGIRVTFVPFHSHLYPYAIKQPSAYRHIVIKDTAAKAIDYFFPALGDSATNVNIYADHHDVSLLSSLRDVGGRNVRRAGYLVIMRKRRPVMRAEFTGLRERWTVEQIEFKAGGRVWHLAISFAWRNRSQVPLMRHMLRTFVAR